MCTNKSQYMNYEKCLKKYKNACKFNFLMKNANMHFLSKYAHISPSRTS